jgi:hypothetical protein
MTSVEFEAVLGFEAVHDTFVDCLMDFPACVKLPWGWHFPDGARATADNQHAPSLTVAQV